MGDIEEGGFVKIDIVEIDRVIDGVKNANDHEFFSETIERFTDSDIGTKEIHGELVTNDDGRLSKIIIEERASVDGEAEDLLNVRGGADDLGGVDGKVASGGINRDS